MSYSYLFPFEERCEHGTCNDCNTSKDTLPDMYTRAQGHAVPGESADISGKARMPVSQLICYTFDNATVFISPHRYRL